MNILIVTLSLLAVTAVTLGDKPAPEYPGSSGSRSSSSSSSSKVEGSVTKVSPQSTKYAQSKQDTYGSPQAAPVATQDSYGSPQATPIAAAPAAPAATPGDVGTQGYYYYYYPVSNNVAAGSTSHHTSTSYEPAGSTGPDLAGAGILGLLAGKGVLAAIVIGGLIVLAILGTTGINLQGRSLTNYIYDNLDDITNMVMNAVDVYQQLNSPQ